MPRHSRRDVLRLGGTGLALGTTVGLAGCSGGGDGKETTTGGDGGGQTTTKSEPFKIGYLQPLSGPISPSGVPATNMTKLTVEAINSRGGLDGRPIELIAKDTKATPDTAVKRARELVTQENVDLLAGTTSSAVAKTITEFASSQNTIFLAQPAQTPDLNHKLCKKTTFRTTTNLIHLQRAMAEGMAAQTPESATRVVGLNPDYVYGHQSYEVFKKEFKKLRPDVEFVDEFYPSFQKGDYSKEIQATLDADPDIVHSVLYAGDMISFMKQAKQFDFFDKIGAFTYVSTMSVIYSLGNQFPDGNIFGTVVATPNWPQSDTHSEFTTKYMEKHDDPPTQIAYEAGGVMHGLEAAVKAGGGTSNKAIIDGFEGLTYESMRPKTTVRAADHQGILSKILVDQIEPLDDADRYGFKAPFNTVNDDKFAEEPTCDFG